ncbi:restriction endonuclease subunit S [Streptomyces pseudogriseolus]|uniref:restriction endonuclease subunit S n=1 Tax=Streptomyces pseudogriseolus TaxID=36817 RepID=UPI003FA306AE
MMNPDIEFPSDWTICKVSDAGEAIVGQQRSPAVVKGIDQQPYLRVANVFDDELDLRDLAKMAFTPEARQKYVLKAGDVLLCEGQSRELVGRCALYRGEHEPLFFQNHLIRFRPHELILPEYALLVFRSYQKNGVFSSIAKSTTNIANLGLKRFRDLPFPVPPRQAQAEIVDAARAVQEGIDAARSALANSQPLLERLTENVRDRLILGDGVMLDADESRQHSASDIWQRAADVVEPDAPIVYGILQPGKNVTDGSGVPYVQQQDLRDGAINMGGLRATSPATAQKHQRSTLAAGDVLLGIIRNTRVAVVPAELDGGNINRGIARFRPKEGLDSQYLAHWLASGSAQSWLAARMRGIDMPGLNLRDVRKLPIPVVDLVEQRRIAETLDDTVASLIDLTHWVKRSLEKITQMENWALTEFAYGRVAAEISSNAVGDREAIESNFLVERLKSHSPQDAEKRLKRKRVTVKTPPKDEVLGKADGDSFVALLQNAGGSLVPEELYRGLHLEDEDIDEFFEILRDLVNDGRVRVARPDNTLVVIEAV